MLLTLLVGRGLPLLLLADVGPDFVALDKVRVDVTHERVMEPRLEEKVAQVLGVPRIVLYAPPAEVQDPYGPMFGIQVEQFPLWFVADVEERKGRMRSRLLVHRNSLENNKIERERRKYDVTPVRFVQACSNGHIADIEWREFTHGGRTSCTRDLWLDEYGTSGDLTDSLVRCECGVTRALAQATKRDVLGQCKGQRPWLSQGEKCGGPNGTPEMMRLLNVKGPCRLAHAFSGVGLIRADRGLATSNSVTTELATSSGEPARSWASPQRQPSR